MKKNYLKIIIVVLVIWVISFSDWTFAEDLDEKTKLLNWILKFIATLAQWLWIPFAKIAGVFLTNKMVYGELFWLDAILWKYWNVMKNLANFSLWFYLIYLIFSGLFDKDITSVIKDKLKWVLIAGLWIQASWFLTAAVIDLSSVTIVTAWSIPSLMISQDTKLHESIKSQAQDFFNKRPKSETDVGKNYAELITTHSMKVTIFPVDSKASDLVNLEWVPIEWTEVNEDSFLDRITPWPDSIDGPLMYIWLMILETYKTEPAGAWMDKFINLMLTCWTSFIYWLEMIVLCAVWFMRLFYLWLFILVSPFVILFFCVWKTMKNTKWMDGDFLQELKIETFLWNVFKPTIIVLGFSVALMFSSLIKEFTTSNQWKSKIEMNWITFSSSAVKDWDREYFDTSLNSSILWVFLSWTRKTLTSILVSLMTVILVFVIIRYSIGLWTKNWKSFVSDKAAGLQKIVWNVLWSVPIVPVGEKIVNGEKKKVSFTLWNFAWKHIKLGDRENKTIVDYVNNSIDKKISKYNNNNDINIRRFMGEEVPDLMTENEKKLVQNLSTGKTTNINDIKWAINWMKSQNWKGFFIWKKAKDSLTSYWQKQFINIIDNGHISFTGELAKFVEEWNKMKKEDKRKGNLSWLIENLFSNVDNSKDYRKAYFEFFGIKWNKYETWESFQTIDITRTIDIDWSSDDYKKDSNSDTDTNQNNEWENEWKDA